MTPSEHVGARIKMYRQKKHLTLGELAKLVNRSPSTLSKYESGKIIIDINSIFEIAEALGINPNQLLDYHRSDTVLKASYDKNFFTASDIYYAYALFPSSKAPHQCVFEIIRSDNVNRFIMYFDISDIKNYTNSKYLYSGILNCCDYGATFHITNPYSESDSGFIYAKAPFSTKQIATGIFTFLPQSLRSPCATKIIFSLSPLEVNDDLAKELSVSDKETIAEIKKKNLFIVM